MTGNSHLFLGAAATKAGFLRDMLLGPAYLTFPYAFNNPTGGWNQTSPILEHPTLPTPVDQHTITWTDDAGRIFVGTGEYDPVGGTTAHWLEEQIGDDVASQSNSATQTSGNPVRVNVWLKKDVAATNTVAVETRASGTGSSYVAGGVVVHLGTGEIALHGTGYSHASCNELITGWWLVSFMRSGPGVIGTSQVVRVRPAWGYAADFPNVNHSATGGVYVYGPQIFKGTPHAWAILDNSTTLYQSVGSSTGIYISGEPLYGSIWLKKDVTATFFSEVKLRFDVTDAAGSLAVSVATGQAINRGGTGDYYNIVCEERVPGWWHLSFAHPGHATANSVSFRVYPASGTATYPFATASATATGLVYLYAPQIRQHVPGYLTKALPGPGDITWVSSGGPPTITSGHPDVFGSNFAWRIADTSSSAWQSAASTIGSYTSGSKLYAEMWVQNDTTSPSPFCQFQIAFDGVYNQHSVMFNLSTGAHNFNYGTMSGFFAEQVGTWWRVRITHPGAAGSTVRLRIHPASGTTYPTDSAAGVGAIYVYGAQIWQFVPT